MINPLVSIIIPLYNAEEFIVETILSAINQTYKNIEIIIIDDGSTDNSLNIAKSFEGGKIKTYHQPNKGVSATRNMGINHARGYYIQFLDADDLLHPNKIELQVGYIEKNSISSSFICSNWARIDERSTLNGLNIQHTYKPETDNEITTYITGDNFIPLMSGLIKRETVLKINGFDEKMTHIEDVNLLLRLFVTDNNFVFMPSEMPLFYYRSVNNSASQKNLEAFLNGIYTNYIFVRATIHSPNQNRILFNNIWFIYVNAVKNNYKQLVFDAKSELKNYGIMKNFSLKFMLFKLFGNKTYIFLSQIVNK